MKNALRSIGWLIIGISSLLHLTRIITDPINDASLWIGLIIIIYSLSNDVDKIQ